MKNYKRLILAFIFSCISAFVANAQNQTVYFSPGVIHLKNGEKMECFINCNSLLYSSPVDYRLSEKDKIKEMDPEKIHSIVMPADNGDVYIVENVSYLNYKDYLSGKNKELKHLRYSVVEYGDVCLYSTTVLGVGTYNRYICRKKDMDYGVFMGMAISVKKSAFSKKISYKTKEDCLDKVYENLFGDYPELCQQIREGKLTLHDMKDIVHEYNVYKAGKSGKDK